jgi:tRNA 2-thiouridine synthesizing protein A
LLPWLDELKADRVAMNVPFDKDLDASGLACPLPVIRTRKALAAMDKGQVLRVVSTDAGSASDLPVFAQSMGHVLLSSSESAGQFVFFIRKG